MREIEISEVVIRKHGIPYKEIKKRLRFFNQDEPICTDGRWSYGFIFRAKKTFLVNGLFWHVC